MKIYNRGERYLVVLGHIPQWLVVDSFGLNIVQKIVNNSKLEDILREYNEDEREDVEVTYAELLPLLTRVVNRDSTSVENALTSKTTVAMISVTRECNLKNICPHCYVDAKGLRNGELTTTEHRELGKQLFARLATDDNKVYKVNLTGGEPFSRKDILEIIHAYREAGFHVNMSTNAMMIKDSDMPALKEMGVTLSVSMDGSCPETHDRIRGKGAWKRVVDRIKKLTSNGIRVGINFLVHQENFGDLEKSISLANEIGCSGFNPINLIQLGRADKSNLLRVSEVEIFKRLVGHLTTNANQRHLFANSSLFSSMGAALLAGITCESCGVGNRPCVYIDEVGTVYPCPNTQKPEFRLGNIRSDSLSNCVQLDHPVLQRLRTLQVSTLNDKCAACDVRYFCGGDCRGETHNVTGDLRAPYVACEDRHDSIVELMWIVSESPDLFETRADEYDSNLH